MQAFCLLYRAKSGIWRIFLLVKIDLFVFLKLFLNFLLQFFSLGRWSQELIRVILFAKNEFLSMFYLLAVVVFILSNLHNSVDLGSQKIHSLLHFIYYHRVWHVA
jgi:hypothetical protein